MVLRYLLFRYHGVDGNGRLGEWLLLRAANGSDSDIHRVPADPQIVTVLPNLSLTPYDRDRGSHTSDDRVRSLITVCCNEKENTKRLSSRP